jgi:hypothetical protein
LRRGIRGVGAAGEFVKETLDGSGGLNHEGSPFLWSPRACSALRGTLILYQVIANKSMIIREMEQYDNSVLQGKWPRVRICPKCLI